MQTVKLRNGAEEFAPLVATTMLSLRHLLEKEPVAFYELVQLCRNKGHKLWDGTGEILRGLGLLRSDGTVHDSVRNVVLCAVHGDGLDMVLRSPWADDMKAR